MSVHCQADDERFSFEAFTRHPFFTEVNRWIVERVIGPGRSKIVDLGCGPGAVTKLILERLGGDARNVEVIGIDPSPTALSKARAAIHSQVVKFIEGSAEWVSRIVSSVDAVVFLNAIHLVPDKAQVISEIRKTLNKDGVFAFNTTFFNGAYVDGTGAFWRRWVVRAVQFFFFSSRRRHTRLQGDWSSDVCSSDLPASWSWNSRPRARWPRSCVPVAPAFPPSSPRPAWAPWWPRARSCANSTARPM